MEPSPLCFGEWLKGRRLALDLTQEQLAKLACCTVFAIRKIESGERHPSRELAGLLAQALEIPAGDQAAFVKAARGDLSVERLAVLARPAAGVSQQAAPPAAVPAQPPHALPKALPRSLMPFVGREPELASLGQLLQDPQCALISIVGPGGIGKTRLAIEAAQQVQDRFPDGIWFVPLAPLTSPALIVPTIADVLDFKFSEQTNHQAQLLGYLQNKKALLVLDNAEHLLEGVGLFPLILERCPQVKLLVTSRERLNLLSEWVFEIMGLPVPPGERVEQFESYSAVALFVQSARRAQAGFALREEQRGGALRICQVLEGMPLGIELAAAWVGLLSCAEIAAEIERNIDFLAVSMRDLPERHRSLRATLEHSWKLLSAEEQRILSRLSVFHGSFRREAAQEICGASLAVLAALRDKMLLHRTEQGFYMLHELIRQYAEGKLREDPAEDERVNDRHSAYYVRCLAEWEQALKSSRQVETYHEMARVIADLSRGWLRMVTQIQPATLRSDPLFLERYNRALFSLSLFYEMNNRGLEALPIFAESVAYLKRMQGAVETTEDSAVFYTVLGHTSMYLGLHYLAVPQREQACAYLEEAVGWLEKGQARRIKAQAQVILAALYGTPGQLQRTAAMLEQCLAVFQEEGDDWWYLIAVIQLAPAYVSLGKQQEIEGLLQEGLGRAEPGDLRLGLPLRKHYAYVLNLKKEYARAEQLLQESLALCYQYGDMLQVPSLLFELGRAALAGQRVEQAQAYLQQSIDAASKFRGVAANTMTRIYLGKCFAARQDRQAARDQFRQAIQDGQASGQPFIIYWALVCIARTYLEEGQTNRALEMALALRHCRVEYIRIKEEGDRLLAELRAELSEEQVEAAMKKVDSGFTPDQDGEKALAYALERGKE